MEEKETSPPLKLTLQKRNTRGIVLVIVVSISLAGLASVAIGDSCEIQHVDLLADINEYEQTMDPDFCYSVVERIGSFNDKCDIHLEILDCG